MRKINDIALQHFELSENFLDMVGIILTESIKQGNKTYSIQSADKPKLEKEIEHRNQTKWSDEKILIPVLFNFFHGLELLLKGFKYIKNPPIPRGKNTKHDIKILMSTFEKEYPANNKLIEIFKYYIIPETHCEILSNFYKTNNISDSNQFIHFFKYPTNGKFTQEFDFKALKKTKDTGIEFFKKVIADIEIIRTEKKE
jgi:hypothetical protein